MMEGSVPKVIVRAIRVIRVITVICTQEIVVSKLNTMSAPLNRPTIRLL